MITDPAQAASLIQQITDALNELEKLGVDVQMPATFNGLGVRTDAGTITFEDIDDGSPIASITWDQDWVLARRAGAEVQC